MKQMKKKNKNFIYTNKKHSAKGMFSCALALMVSVALVGMINYTFRHDGVALESFGAGALLCTIFTLIGLLLSVFGRYDSERFMHFVHLGILWNVINFLAISGILYAGT
ncbi:MAG: hypothetical protein MJ123_09515 [Lachnospiraceae bacterium]|nr:hypothetical protein [Lachnospiraceae bacterium]